MFVEQNTGGEEKALHCRVLRTQEGEMGFTHGRSWRRQF